MVIQGKLLQKGQGVKGLCTIYHASQESPSVTRWRAGSIDRDGRRLPDLFREDIGILFLMAFTFPKKHEAKSTIMREGTERGWLWDFEAE